MNVTFENTTVVYDNNIADVLINFVNQIFIAYNEDTLRQLVADYAEKTAFDKYFVHGYSKHHFWMTQKNHPSRKGVQLPNTDCRILNRNTMKTKMTTKGVSTTTTPGTEQYEVF